MNSNTVMTGCFESISYLFAPITIPMALIQRAIGMRGRTSQQKQAIKYLTASGCLEKLIGGSDAEFDSLLMQRVKPLNIFQQALGKLGLVAEQVSEIAPLFFDGYAGGSTRLGEDLVFRQAEYQLSCVLFSDEQVFLYSYTIDLTSNKIREWTDEYFYSDITSVTVKTPLDELYKEEGCGCIGTKKFAQSPNYSFKLVVPGDSMFVAFRPEELDQVYGMKAKLREKKEQV